VQLVEILYTKASRGAPNATRRNNLPRAFPMQAASEDCQYRFEHYRLLEGMDFVPEIKERIASGVVPSVQGWLVLNAEPVQVTLGLCWTLGIGQPPRRDQPQALVIRDGKVARLIINGRYASHSGQVYTEATYNVAFGNAVAAAVFRTRQPDAVLDLRADLC
jgi:hypothetical protein